MSNDIHERSYAWIDRIEEVVPEAEVKVFDGVATSIDFRHPDVVRAAAEGYFGENQSLADLEEMLSEQGVDDQVNTVAQLPAYQKAAVFILGMRTVEFSKR